MNSKKNLKNYDNDDKDKDDNDVNDNKDNDDYINDVNDDKDNLKNDKKFIRKISAENKKIEYDNNADTNKNNNCDNDESPNGLSYNGNFSNMEIRHLDFSEIAESDAESSNTENNEHIFNKIPRKKHSAVFSSNINSPLINGIKSGSFSPLRSPKRSSGFSNKLLELANKKNQNFSKGYTLSSQFSPVGKKIRIKHNFSNIRRKSISINSMLEKAVKTNPSPTLKTKDVDVEAVKNLLMRSDNQNIEQNIQSESSNQNMINIKKMDSISDQESFSDSFSKTSEKKDENDIKRINLFSDGKEKSISVCDKKDLKNLDLKKSSEFNYDKNKKNSKRDENEENNRSNNSDKDVKDRDRSNSDKDVKDRDRINSDKYVKDRDRINSDKDVKDYKSNLKSDYSKNKEKNKNIKTPTISISKSPNHQSPLIKDRNDEDDQIRNMVYRKTATLKPPTINNGAFNLSKNDLNKNFKRANTNSYKNFKSDRLIRKDIYQRSSPGERRKFFNHQGNFDLLEGLKKKNIKNIQT